mmetsp:Transcript_54118/g.125896  ORF Transcript_54118/g.125896 Transcript_54118/m.125896 type:complete len:112 (-) Transcript_54118:769-1104(-)
MEALEDLNTNTELVIGPVDCLLPGASSHGAGDAGSEAVLQLFDRGPNAEPDDGLGPFTSFGAPQLQLALCAPVCAPGIQLQFQLQIPLAGRHELGGPPAARNTCVKFRRLA